MARLRELTNSNKVVSGLRRIQHSGEMNNDFLPTSLMDAGRSTTLSSVPNRRSARSGGPRDGSRKLDLAPSEAKGHRAEVPGANWGPLSPEPQRRVGCVSLSFRCYLAWLGSRLRGVFHMPWNRKASQ
jgi:hypothetical protein